MMSKLLPLTDPDDLQLNDELHVIYGPYHESNEILHVRGRVDGLVIVREWIPTKKRWRYEVKENEFFRVYIANGNLYYKRKENHT